MKISYNWLKQYLPEGLFAKNDRPAQELATTLTFCGLEVSNVEKFQTVKGGLEGLVVGEVKTRAPHPNAERLSLTTVDIGNGKLLKIVCGAPNVAAGQKVIVAPVGSILYPVSGEEIKIKKSKIRGEESEGMICAEDEIGLGSSHEGIMVLTEEAKPGTSASEYFNLHDDWIFEIELTPNRSDAASHVGVARDLIAVEAGKSSASIPEWLHVKYPDVSEFKVDSSDRVIDVIVENTIACPRYSGLTITGVQVKESPEWLKNRLKAIGQKPINNIVDVTNFILHELGQPLHTFDADEIKDDTVVVKTLPSGSRFITLDGVERKLNEEDLMICSTGEPMCIAGVFGGLKSGVKETTRNIFIESACFNPRYVRKTARRHDLHTEASFRFERGSDVNMTIFALKRAAILLRELAGGKISSGIIDVYPEKIENSTIVFEYEYCDRLIGKKIDRNTIKNILSALQMHIMEESDVRLDLSVPPFKADVLRPADVVEEILRIYGYNNIEMPRQMLISLNPAPRPDKNKIQNSVSGFLSSNGFREIMTNSLTASRYYQQGEWKEENSIRILNPLSIELDVLRQNLLYNGLEVIAYNQNRKNDNLKLFEFGNIYSKKSGGEASDLNNFQEEQHLSVFITGNRVAESWNTGIERTDFFDLKEISENILLRLGISGMVCSEASGAPYLAGGLAYSVKEKIAVQFGKVHPSVLKQYSIKLEVYYADFHWNNILHLLIMHNINFRDLPRFPSVRRDLAMILDRNINYAEIESLAYEAEKFLLKEVNLFDVFEDAKGIKIPAGKKSYAVSFTFLDEKKTLTDMQVEKMMERLMKLFETRLGAQIRKG